MPARAQVAPVDEQTPALVTFTSGSTGEPKAAVRTHGFLLAQHAVLEESLSLAPGEVDLTTLPIFVLANLASGVTSVIPDADLRYPGRIEPGPVFEQLRQLDRTTHRLVGRTRIAASPALLARLAAHTRETPHAAGGVHENLHGRRAGLPEPARRVCTPPRRPPR